jgi:hypothetical protein
VSEWRPPWAAALAVASFVWLVLALDGDDVTVEVVCSNVCIVGFAVIKALEGKS